MLNEDEKQDTATPALQIIAAADSVVPVLRDRILELSPEAIDEETWLRILAGRGSSGRTAPGRAPSFDSPADLLTVLAEFDGSLAIGGSPLRARWARDAITHLTIAHTRPDSVDAALVTRFTDTLAMLMESIGLGMIAAEAPAADRPGTRLTDHHLHTELDELAVELVVHDVYSQRLAAAGISPIISIALTNSGKTPVVVSTLEAAFAGRSERENWWRGPEIEIPAGDTVHLDRYELSWNPSIPGAAGGSTGTTTTGGSAAKADVPTDDELIIAIGAAGRSRELTAPVSWIPAGSWSLAAPPELVADFVHSADPAIHALAATLPAPPGPDEEPRTAAQVLELAARAVDHKLTVTPEQLGEAPASFRTPSAVRAAGTASTSERALLIAGLLEYLDVPVALIGTRAGLYAGVGHSFDIAEVTALRSHAAVQAELSAMTTAGVPHSASRTGFTTGDAAFIVDLGAARGLIGAADTPAPATAGAGRGDAAGTSGVGGAPAAEPRSFHRWKRELLDLSFTNPLLRLRATSGAALQVPREALAEFEDRLSAGTAFSLQPRSRTQSTDRGLPVDRYRLGSGGHGGLGGHKPVAEPVADLRAGRLTAVPYSGSFDTRLQQLSQEARKSKQENGYPSLFVTIGSVEWLDRKGKEGHSPLLLAPVNITGTARTGYGIHLEPGGEMQTNQSLAEKLRGETGQQIPVLSNPPTDAAGLDVERVLAQLPHDLQAAGIGARIHHDVRLVRLAYGTLPQWRDLNDNWRELLRSPVAEHITRTPFARFRDPRPPAELTPDSEVSTWLPSRADSSQLDAVVAAGNGNSFVLEGPPGTGKSQTITNMIADGLARGRRILFVAEKQAALDVVQRRLRAFGLDPLVLDVHSSRQSGRAVREQLAASLKVPAQAQLDRLAAARRELAEVVARLRAYPEALHGQGGPSDSTAAASGAAASTGHDENVWSLFQTCLEEESELDPTAEWQPEHLAPAELLAHGEPDEAQLAGLAKRIRRLRRRVDGDVSERADNQDGDVVQLRKALRELADAGLIRPAAEISRGRSADKLAEAISLALARERLRRAVEESGLNEFSGTDRAQTVRRYVELAEQVTALTRDAMVGVIAGRRSWNAGDGPSPEFTAEVNKVRGGTIRRLFQEFGDEVLSTTPCVLMSPAGASKYLPVAGPRFDTVIFDEASQITTASAIGALGRAQAAVIVGDSQQMPPSTEFAADTEEELPEAETEGRGTSRRLESVLTQAVNAGFERKWLQWHYRSRNEELIAFSNRKYYRGKLASFPAPPVADRKFPVDLRFIGGEYAKGPGGAKVNRAESEAVVAEVHARLTRSPEKSIAVVTFNASQRTFIENALESSGDPRILAALSSDGEPLMVKNVDNVQGDERDVVLFSIGYAPDRRTGRLNQSFGPVNRAGGERRFNVAITRAREEIVIFTSLRSDDLDLRSSRSRGLQDLRDYLADAERGSVVRRQSVSDRSTLYRDQIAARLRERGLTVETGVGTSSFVVDLAVRVGDSGWLALLLDPPSWAAMPTAWDRDGLPITVLEGSMGWIRTERVLVADWLTDPGAVVEKVADAAQRGLEATAGVKG
ncbi:hypothetical protein GCM10022261_17200 [Brevibacterium daeguense]|uniref:AAA domain-containing protein n=1 Tax=Brevibacterium daeguense TaxID=909936 RepID=A0ABP8EJR7_9MICO|nr:DUF4011 domain-containing protein [Brevibacterium daeguense]